MLDLKPITGKEKYKTMNHYVVVGVIRAPSRSAGPPGAPNSGATYAKTVRIGVAATTLDKALDLARAKYAGLDITSCSHQGHIEVMEDI